MLSAQWSENWVSVRISNKGTKKVKKVLVSRMWLFGAGKCIIIILSWKIQKEFPF